MVSVSAPKATISELEEEDIQMGRPLAAKQG